MGIGAALVLSLTCVYCDAQMPSYDDFFPKNWANNPAVEARHREIDRKIVAWPRDEAGQIDANMLMLMTIIILFNSDFTNLKNRYGQCVPDP